MELRYENGWTGNRWLLNRMNGLLNEVNRAPAPRRLAPATDVVEEKEAYRFYFEAPGMKSESFNVRVENGALIVEGERKRPEWSEQTRVHVAERQYGQIRRAFELPEDASPDHVHASYKDGVLEITVEKKPELKPIKIQVN